MVIQFGNVLKFIVSVVVLFDRFEEFSASKYPKVLQPESDSHTATVGSSFNARCVFDSPVVWRKRGNDRAFKRYKSIGHKYFEASLELYDVQVRDIGYYDCQPINISESAGHASFYLYVDDPAHLMVGPRIVRSSSVIHKPAVVPCRPTALDVIVRLLTSTRDAMPFSLDPKIENKKIYFDPQRGFILPAHMMTASLYIYICQFSKRGVRQDTNVELYIGSAGFVWQYAEPAYKASSKREVDAEEGATVKFVAEIFANFDPNITWYDNNDHVIVTDDKYKVEHTVGDNWETSLTISNVDENDIGFYTVSSTATDRLRFRLDVGAPRYLKLDIPRVFMKNDDHFMAFCYGNYSRVYTDVSWTFRPQGCAPKHDCEETIEPFFMYHADGCMMDLFGVKMLKPLLGNLTCSVQYQDRITERVTKQIVISEVGDGFGILETLREPGTSIATCVVSRFLYSRYVFWIDPDGYVIDNNIKSATRNITLTRSENTYSHKLVLRVDDGGRASNGEYRCMAVDHSYVPSFKSYSLYTTAQVPPKIVKTNMRNTSVYVERNTNLKLSCRAAGSPRPVVYWYKDDAMVVQSAQEHLEIADAKFEDSGRYGCEAFNIYGSNYVFTDLVVFNTVNFTMEAYLWKEKPLVVQVSNTIAFYCNADGQPNITWFKNGVKLAHSSRVAIREDSSFLVIDPARLEDTGLYSCNAEHGAGPWAVAITVEEKPDPEDWVISGTIRDVSGILASTVQTWADW